MAQYEELTIDQGSDQTIVDSDAITFNALVADPASDGIVSLTLTNAQTDLLTPGRYFYDVEISFVDSDSSNTIIERVMEGIIQVTPSITRI